MLTGFWEDMFRRIFFFIDQIIYKLIPTIYDFVEILAKQQLLDQPTIQKFATNIYSLLAVFMLFRLAFVLLNAFIDPDKLTNKEKGFGKIMTRFITGMFLIIIIPWAFEYAFKLQDVILSNNIINKVIFGGQSGTTESAGLTLSKTTLSAFYYCDDPASDTSNTDANGNVIVTYTCDLAKAYDQAFASPASADDTTYKATRKTGWTTLSDSLNLTTGDYRYYYSAGISTVCGIIILLMLITLSIDVAIRVVKLSFLQLITPVAVVGYIEPGGKRFQEWLKVCISTYLNLFIRLLAISIAAYIISIVDPNNFTPIGLDNKPIESFLLSSFVRIFIILGSLLFAKEAPKMLSDILGIKEASMGSLNPLKKIGAAPIVGGMAAAGVGLGAGLAMRGAGGTVGALAGGLNSKLRGGSFGAGAIRGGGAAMKNVPLKGKFGAQAKGLIGSYRKASNAGATSAKGIETKTGLGNWANTTIGNKLEQEEFNAREQVIENKENDVLSYFRSAGVGADEAGLFKNDSFKEAYKSFSNQKGAVKKARGNVSELNNKMAQRQAEYAAARNNYQAHIAEYKDAENIALAEMNKINPTTDSVAYSAAQEKYNDAKDRVSFLENNISGSQRTFTEAQDAVIGAEKELKKAETALSVKEAAFEEQRKMVTNKKDAEVYATYKRLNDTGKLDEFKKK
jgi:hypothetical protein